MTIPKINTVHLSNFKKGSQSGVVIYDGECAFCINQVHRIQQLDRKAQFEYLPRQDSNTELRFPVLATEDFNSGMRLISPEGKLYVGADAIYQIAMRLPGLKYIAWLYQVPGIRQLAQLAYAWVAANRKKLARNCTNHHC